MGLAGVGWVLEGRARVWERFGKGAEVAQEVLREGLGGSWDGLAGSCGGLGGSYGWAWGICGGLGAAFGAIPKMCKHP